MRKIIVTFLCLFYCYSFSQKIDLEKIQDSIMSEALKLYQSEMASWYGTDIFLENYKERENIGGYFSYPRNTNETICVFFDKNEIPNVIGSIAFDSTFNVNTAILDVRTRNLTTKENDIFQIRKNALFEIQKDTLFKRYNNTNFNIIPLIENDSKKVYILTGPKVSGVMILGNDYLLTYNNDNELVSKKSLHKNIIPLYYEGEDGKEQESSIHNHLEETGEFITATDICTLMLYGKYTSWRSHIVVSKDYMSIWNIKTNSFQIIENESVKKIVND